MDINIGLSLAQVIIGLISLAVAATAITIVVKVKSQKQVQKTGDNSFNIQSGGETNVFGDVKNEK